MTICRSYPSSPKEKIAKPKWRTYSRWQFTLIPVVSSSDMTYANVVSIPVENTTDIYNHTSPLIPQVAPVRLMLQGQH
jgi:hypothetical protein